MANPIILEQEHLVLSWGERVNVKKGLGGKVRGAYLMPRSGKVTHLVIQRGLSRRNYLIDIDSAIQGEDGIQRLPRGHQRVDVSPRRGSVRLTPKTMVHCADGSSLPLLGVILAAGSCNIEAIIVTVLKKPRVIPHDQVRKLSSGSPSIPLRQDALMEMPIYVPDQEAYDNAMEALATCNTSHYDAYRVVQVEVKYGVARLTGNVRFPIDKKLAENSVREATGILGVSNEIVTDWDLCIYLSEALAYEKLTYRGLVLIESFLGRISLQGHLDSQDSTDLAVAVVDGVSGVRSLRNDIRLEAVPTGESLVTLDTNNHDPDPHRIQEYVDNQNTM
ncbi:BON domain-containing protein [Dehalococcoidia bacterium]|nr:BON domain-containing protein [Dehalococcoidia bacterium]